MAQIGCIQTKTLEERLFYATVLNDEGDSRFLLGPYETHGEALATVERAKDLAIEYDRRAFWYAYGTASAPADVEIKTIFGR